MHHFEIICRETKLATEIVRLFHSHLDHFILLKLRSSQRNTLIKSADYSVRNSPRKYTDKDRKYKRLNGGSRENRPINEKKVPMISGQ